MGKSADSVGIAFDLAGTKLAVGRIDDKVTLIDVARGQTIRAFDTTFFSSNQVALSGDGRILVHASSGNQTAQVVHSPEQSLSSPAMQAIINAKRRVTAWNTQTGDVLFTEAADPESLEKVAISRDGTLLAAGGTRTFLWELSTHKLIRRFDLQCAAVAFSPDGQQLALAASADIHILNVATGTEVAVLRGHQGLVTSLAFDSKGRLASGSLDGSAKLWNIKEIKEVVTVFPLGNSDYVIATPDNYYMTSRAGVSGVAFRIGQRVFPFEQFDLRFNRPDKVLARLGSTINDNALTVLYEERVRRLGFEPADIGEDFHVLELRIDDPAPPPSSSQPDVHFKVSASDSLYELNRINVYVDGVPIHGFRGIELSQRHKKSVEDEVTVPLSNGTNKIQVSVVNEKGVESLADTLQITYSGAPVKPALYLLSIGVSKYNDPSNDLILLCYKKQN